METPAAKYDFVRTIVAGHLADGTHKGRVVTRFPPEPNGYLHIGHAKSICLNFGIAQDFDGVCHMRFDDTNPAKEEVEYVESIQNDIRWLGFDWGDHLFFASNYFEQLYQFAVQLIKDGKAYVCDLNDEQTRELRGTLSSPGRPSPFRDRSVEENLDLFARMRAGEFEDGERVLRGRIDMANANMLMRDPLFYRIRHVHHHRTGDTWCIYPLYDFAHCLSDAIECITHSICTLEFENNRELYDWILDALKPHLPEIGERPHQYEFARLNLAYTMMSKRNLLQLVKEGVVNGWDDPRMPTVAGMRRRGYTPEAIRAFCAMIGVAKANSMVDIQKLEYCVRDDLNKRVPRRMAVLDPLKVVIENFPEGEVRWIDAPSYPHDVPLEGSRPVPFGKTLFIERSDFQEHPEKKFYRLAPGREVRLRAACFLTCDSVVKDPETGEVTELRCSWDPASWGGSTPDNRKVKSTLHWVAEAHGQKAEVRLYDRLFSVVKPGTARDFREDLNPNSLKVIEAIVEPSLRDDPAGTSYQFERKGYFISDGVESSDEKLVFNRIVGLRDTWAKLSDSDVVTDVASTSAPPKEVTGRVRPQKLTRLQIRERIRAQNTELARRYQSYQDELGLSAEDADLLTGDEALSLFFEAALTTHDDVKATSTWVINEVLRELKDTSIEALRFDGQTLGRLVKLVAEKAISASAGKQVFAVLVKEGGDPVAIVDERGLRQVEDPDALAPIIAAVLSKFPDKVAEYRGGKVGLFGFFMGQVMRSSGGNAKPGLVKTLLKQALDQG